MPTPAFAEEKKPDAPTPAPVVEPEADKKKAPLSEDALIPPENKKDGGAGKKDEKADKKPAKEEVTEKEAERRKAVVAKWEQCLGKWLGGPLSALVLEHVSLDALNGYVDQGLKAAGPALGGALNSGLKGKTKPQAGDQEKALKAYSDALSGAMTGLVEQWMASPGGQKVLKSISNFIQGNPGWTMGIVGTALIGGAIGAWFANADLSKIEVPLNLPKGWDLKLGLDLGTIQNLGFNGAAITVANKSQGFSFSAKGKQSEKETDKKDAEGNPLVEKKKEGSAELVLGKDKEPKFTFGVNGSITDSGDGLVVYTAGQKVELVDPINGVKISIDEKGKWDTKGNRENSFTYAASAGKEDGLNGAFNFNATSATVVDQQGNIVDIASRKVGVAIGKKALKFKASASEKAETKGGETKTTKSADVSGEGQLTKGLSFNGQAGVEMTGDALKVKFGGGVTAKVGDKTIELAGNYETDGEVKGRIKLGSGSEYTEVTGTKKGDVVTFSTKEVFKGGSKETTVTSDPTKGVSSKTTATADLGKGASMSMTHGTEGSGVGVKGQKIGGTPLDASAGATFSPDGQVTGANAGLAYNTDLLKAKLDLVMKDAKTTFGASVGVQQGGLKLNTDLKVQDKTLTHFGASVGFRNEAETFSFLAGYKRSFLDKDQAYADRFDLALEYSLERFSTRFAGDLTLGPGGKKGAGLDLGVGYDIGAKKDWQLMAGAKTSIMYDDPLKQNQVGVTPYIGLGFKPANVSVMFNYDTQSQAAFLSLGIPIGGSNKK